MSIANELSSDVAAAVLARSSGEIKLQPDSQELVAMLLNFHTVLRALTIEARRQRFVRAPIPVTETPLTIKQAATGN